MAIMLAACQLLLDTSDGEPPKPGGFTHDGATHDVAGEPDAGLCGALKLDAPKGLVASLAHLYWFNDKPAIMRCTLPECRDPSAWVDDAGASAPGALAVLANTVAWTLPAENKVVLKKADGALTERTPDGDIYKVGAPLVATRDSFMAALVAEGQYGNFATCYPEGDCGWGGLAYYEQQTRLLSAGDTWLAWVGDGRAIRKSSLGAWKVEGGPRSAAEADGTVTALAIDQQGLVWGTKSGLWSIPVDRPPVADAGVDAAPAMGHLFTEAGVSALVMDLDETVLFGSADAFGKETGLWRADRATGEITRLPCATSKPPTSIAPTSERVFWLEGETLRWLQRGP